MRSSGTTSSQSGRPKCNDDQNESVTLSSTLDAFVTLHSQDILLYYRLLSLPDFHAPNGCIVMNRPEQNNNFEHLHAGGVDALPTSIRFTLWPAQCVLIMFQLPVYCDSKKKKSPLRIPGKIERNR